MLDEWIVRGLFPHVCPDFSGVDIYFPLVSGYGEAGNEKSHVK